MPGIKYKDCECFFEYTNLKVDLIEYKCLCCNKNYQKKFDENLKKPFYNTYKFSNHDNNKFILLLWKGVYPYEYMDDWKKIQWDIITWKRRFLQSLKYERYYRLRASIKS